MSGTTAPGMPGCDIHRSRGAPKSVEDALVEYSCVLKTISDRQCREFGLSSSDSNDARQRDGGRCFEQEEGKKACGEEGGGGGG